MRKSKEQTKHEKHSVCITTYFDKSYKEMGELSLKTIRKYAEVHGFDVRLFNKLKTNRPPAWNKILIVQRLLKDTKKYDFVLWVDSDALFVRFNEDIRKEIQPGKDFYLTKHDGPNTGLFLIKSSEWSKKFLEDTWNFKKYIYHNLWENAAINDLLGYRDTLVFNKYKIFIKEILYKLKCKNLITNLIGGTQINKYIYNLFEKPTKSNQDNVNQKEKNKNIDRELQKVKWLDSKWNSVPDYPSSKPIIKHYPSIPHQERLRRMIEDFKGIKIEGIK